MVGILIVTHGQLCRELIASAEMIVGEVSQHIVPVSIGWHDDVNEVHREIEQAIQAADQGEGVLILTDMFGGTPSNIALSFLEKNRIEIITGANLPMVIKLASQKDDKDLHSFAQAICEQGRKNITLASALIK
ncbi:MAG: PTS sugar transporter subunit IIA [Acidobacteria bacterium]|nr:PTS sugar transporter subunit IIA [Acidobacteriota bacterium]MBI3658420.1 PTS sugar transporter subunit IIA [Acidobacteriota bacterium]